MEKFNSAERRNHIFGRMVFSISVIFLYKPLAETDVNFSLPICVAATVLTVLVIWLPRKFRKVPYFLSLTVGTLLLTAWQYFALPRMSVTDSLLPAIILLAGAPERLFRFTVILTSFIVLASVISESYPGNLWSAVSLIGVYMGVRSIQSRHEMKEMEQRYVTNLESTLEELKSAQAKLEADAAQSMHYAAQAERFRIARDIHDGLGHQLTSLIVQLQALSYMIAASTSTLASSKSATAASATVSPKTAPSKLVSLPRDSMGDRQTGGSSLPLAEIQKRMAKLLEVARAALAEVRRAVRAWEETDDSYGLAALSAVIEEIRSTTQCRVNFQVSGKDDEEWPVGVQTILYRVLQETLANVVRHSNATQVDVQLSQTGQEVKMTVTDNGFAEEDNLKPGFGLRNMKARCEEIGGSCRWQVRPEGGVQVEVALPVPSETAAEE